MADFAKTASPPPRGSGKRFREEYNGKVGSVSYRSRRRMMDFVMIAKAGGGEATLVKKEREIMKQLVVMVFVSRHRVEVLRALHLD